MNVLPYFFAVWLTAAPERRVGQVTIRHLTDGWHLTHMDDAERDDLERHADWTAARALANLDDTNVYRPLKTAPNLRHGWRLILPEPDAVRLALGYFYPGMIGLWRAHAAGTLLPVHLRETLNRQTGMYRITQKLTNEQAQELIGAACQSATGCIKTVLWKIEESEPIRTLDSGKFQEPEGRDGAVLPLFCHEACNILVAAARPVVKRALQPA